MMSEDINPSEFFYGFTATADFSTVGKGICLAAASFGLIRSDDGGRTWQPALESLSLSQPVPITSLVLSPDFARDGTILIGAPGAVIRSEDRGAYWTVFPLPSPPPVVSSLAISPEFQADGVILAGTMEDGIFYSNNRGEHWTSRNFGLLDLNVLCLGISPDFKTDGIILAGTDSGIFRSTNGGRAWREVSLPGGYDPVISLAFSPAFLVDAALFAGTESHGLLVSNDRGRTWRVLNDQEADVPINGILVSPLFSQKPELMVLSGHHLRYSADFGRHWIEGAMASRQDVEIQAIYALADDPDRPWLDHPLLIGLDGGKIRLTSGRDVLGAADQNIP